MDKKKLIKILNEISTIKYVLISASLIIAASLILYFMGQPLICKCSYIKLWHGVVFSSENSQHIFDWYTPSHIIHGVLFFGLLWLLMKKLSFGFRFLIATILEAGWEIFENTDMVINRYREATISLDYFGDSVINSFADMLAMVLGFFLVRKLPVWASITIVVVLELFVGYFIHDNLILNIIMLIYPIKMVLAWQQLA
ncbi:hypothetical protein COV11_02305 [Candidatus Woesearchaeota archaeon CG10_big_fil_rev_8_21_14_0_10_30_7]|nr:MAG: hypothetical protein COV11_02305 [Candidatus Woesearchaeota archaeon CG10_big_fil_rev_8_21_14_0_10_30_7]